MSRSTCSVTSPKELKVGNGLDDGVQQGPLIDIRAVEKVEYHIEDATTNGAKLVAGGSRHELGGTFFQPTVLSNVTTGDGGQSRGDLWTGGAHLQVRR